MDQAMEVKDLGVTVLPKDVRPLCDDPKRRIILDVLGIVPSGMRPEVNPRLENIS
jgi:hypothetical protein